MHYSKRFHRHYIGQPALLDGHYRRAIPSAPSDFTGIIIAGNRHYSTGTIDEPLVSVSRYFTSTITGNRPYIGKLALLNLHYRGTSPTVVAFKALPGSAEYPTFRASRHRSSATAALLPRMSGADPLPPDKNVGGKD